jgi:serine/threonine-protein kinase
MVSSDLGACEWFVWDLRRSGLIDRGQLDQVVGDFLKSHPRAEPPALSDYLVRQGVLSPFQAERILSGKTQGLVLGPYILADAIGAGSMGQVYKAQSKTDGQWYAVKVLPRRSMWNVRLARRQVRSFTQFSHTAVVPFVDVGTAGGQHYLVWPLAEGETLEARVEREGALPPNVAATLMSEVAEGLSQAHSQGVFHGLLKPSNILIGSDGQARILDFGIGSLLAENEGESLVDTMSTANTLTSGLDCSSPESIMEPTNRTPAGDQYSFGCVLYYVLTGKYPFGDGTAVEKMMAHQFKQPTPLRQVAPHVPDGMAAVVDRLMQKSAEGRYPGLDEVAEALKPFAAEPVKGSRFGGSQHGLGGGRPGGSHFGTAPSPVAHAAPPPPARYVVPPTQYGGTTLPEPLSAHIPTPEPGPLTPPPAPRAPKARPAAPAAPPAARPAPPAAPARPMPVARPAPPPVTERPARVPRSRAGQNALPVAEHDDIPIAEALPVALPLDTEAPMARSVGRNAYGQQKGGSSTFMVFLIAALVTAGMYVLGKTVLFAN